MISNTLEYAYPKKISNIGKSLKHAGELLLSVTIAYNKSDLELGWQHSKSDFTIYIDDTTSSPDILPSLRPIFKLLLRSRPLIGSFF